MNSWKKGRELLRKKDNIIREIISLYKIKIEHRKKKNRIEAYLEGSKEFSNFNLNPLFNGNDTQLRIIVHVLPQQFLLEKLQIK